MEPAPDYPRLRRLQYYSNLYKDYHEANQKLLPGKLTGDNVLGIARMVKWWQSLASKVPGAPPPKPRLLDYGSGKGYQYLARRVHNEWGGILPICYDPGVIQLSDRPHGRFNGIICTDVMEHLEKEDIEDALNDIRAYIDTQFHSFVYFNISCRLAWKTFADGTNLHKTVELPDFWDPLIKKAFKGSGVKLSVHYQLPPPGEEVKNEVEDGAGNPDPSGGHPLPDSVGEGADVPGEGLVPAEEDQGGNGVRAEEEGCT
jgi:hypothetical protein